jgi:hypothetical protein
MQKKLFMKDNWTSDFFKVYNQDHPCQLYRISCYIDNQEITYIFLLSLNQNLFICCWCGSFRTCRTLLSLFLFEPHSHTLMDLIHSYTFKDMLAWFSYSWLPSDLMEEVFTIEPIFHFYSYLFVLTHKMIIFEHYSTITRLRSNCRKAIIVLDWYFYLICLTSSLLLWIFSFTIHAKRNGMDDRWHPTLD